MKRIVCVLITLVMVFALVAVAAADQTEITVWHTHSEDPSMDNIAEAFMQANPDIKVNAVLMQNEDLRKAIKMALTSGSGPDVFYYDCGPGYMGVLADAGLIKDLGDAVKTYKWDERLAPWGLNAATYKGNVYGIACEYEILVCYYNKQIFEQLGVSAPKSFQEFRDICLKAKDAGLTGLVIDDMDQWPGYHYESLFYGSFGGPQLLDDVLSLNNKDGWNQPQFAQGLDALGQLVKDGLTSSTPNAISHDDALRDFYTGAGAMYLTGTWQIGSMTENMGDNVGMFVFPSNDPSIPTVPPVGVGGGYLVNKNSGDAALKFLDYLYDANGGAKIWMRDAANILPVSVDTTGMDLTPLFLDLQEIANNTSIFNKNIDVLMPQNVNDVTLNFMQQVLDGKITGQQAVELKQAEFAKAIADGTYQ